MISSFEKNRLAMKELQGCCIEAGRQDGLSKLLRKSFVVANSQVLLLALFEFKVSTVMRSDATDEKQFMSCSN